MHNRFLDIAHTTPGTCEWIFDHKVFEEWVTTERGLLWFNGKPGAGKSTLMKYILNNYNAANPSMVLSYFFHGRGDKLQKSPLGLFRSLLHQAFRESPDGFEDITKTFEERYTQMGEPGSKWAWHQEELWQFLKSAITQVLQTKPIILFVDALDECGEEDAVNLIQRFKDLLKHQPVDFKSHQFLISFSSRHYPILDLPHRLEITLEKENKEDISTFVASRLSSSKELLYSEIPQIIVQSAAGVFLWAYFATEEALSLERKGFGPKKIKSAISSLPSQLTLMYRKTMRDMGAMSTRLMKWVCFALRPMSVEELRWAMVLHEKCSNESLQACQDDEDFAADIDKMTRQVKTLSHGLVEVVPKHGKSCDHTFNNWQQVRSLGDGRMLLQMKRSQSTNPEVTTNPFGEATGTTVVQFIHQSVKDFVIGEGLSVLNHGLETDKAIAMAHYQLGTSCMRYLQMKEIKDLHTKIMIKSKIKEKQSLQVQLIRDWRRGDIKGFRGDESQESRKSHLNTLHLELREPVLSLCGEDEGFPFLRYTIMTWTTHMAKCQLHAPAEDLLRIAGWPSNEFALLWMGRQTLLSCAISAGVVCLVDALLKAGADIEERDEFGWTPLALAVFHGHEDMVDFLLEKGANTSLVDDCGQTLIQLANACGRDTILNRIWRKRTTLVFMPSGRTHLSQPVRNEAEIPRSLHQGYWYNSPSAKRT
jgi:hypothetical protein